MPLLRNHTEQLTKSGSRLLKSLSFSCPQPPPRFVDSAGSDMVQVADLAAYNVFRQFRDYGEQWETSGGPGTKLPMYGYFDRLTPKFRQGPDNRVQGFGIVKFPLRKRVLWGVRP